MKPIPGYSRYFAEEDGRLFSAFKGAIRPLQAHTDKKFLYQRVAFYLGNYKYRTEYVHRMVLLAFRGHPPREDMEARHLNGIRTDNRLENLVWGTSKENDADKDLHGTRQHGLNNGMHKLTPEAILEIRNSTEPSRKLGLRYGVRHITILRVKRGETWRHIKNADTDLACPLAG